jgi:hypothetical protein
LCLALGLTPAAAFAQGLQWRPAGTSPQAAPQAGGPSIGLSRPVPLDGPAPGIANPAIPVLSPIVRAQNTEESKPLPPGPLSPGGLNVKSTPITPAVTEQDSGKPGPKSGEFIAPPPQPAKAAPSIWTSAGACNDPCAKSCATSCAGGGLFGHGWLDRCGLGHGLWGADPCNPCDPCARPRYWVFLDYLGWVPQHQSVPPLVTMSPAGTPFGTTGILGANTTSVLFNGFDDPLRSGFRIGGGFWFHEGGNWGIDTSFWGLTPQSSSFISAASCAAAPTAGSICSSAIATSTCPNGWISLRTSTRWT